MPSRRARQSAAISLRSASSQLRMFPIGICSSRLDHRLHHRNRYISHGVDGRASNRTGKLPTAPVLLALPVMVPSDANWLSM